MDKVRRDAHGDALRPGEGLVADPDAQRDLRRCISTIRIPKQR